MRRTWTNIILHCSDSTWGCAREIRRWHLERGWRDIGYHFVILNGRVLSRLHFPAMDGSVECGRMLNETLTVEADEVGSHALGYNANSIGVCLIGKTHITPKQQHSLISLLENLIKQYSIKIENILGHNETESGKKQGKTCPNFNVGLIRASVKEVIRDATRI
ncbi:MAG: hypothetical protein DDT22_01138 [candidate division WS2 bacterium]|nr:hypothetical protein [Candidatus Lithacetigena glycinireducens]